MKTKIYGLLGVFILALTVFSGIPKVLASGGSMPNVINYSTSPVLSTGYTTVVPSTPQGVSSVSVLNTGSYPIYMGIGAASVEVPQLVAPALGAQPVVLPIQLSYGQRISVESIGGNNTSGGLEMNVIYNY